MPKRAPATEQPGRHSGGEETVVHLRCTKWVETYARSAVGRRVVAFALVAGTSLGLCSAQDFRALPPTPALAKVAFSFAGPQEAPTAPKRLGRIEGEVTDTSGALIPGAQVVLRLEGSPAERTLGADRAGHFRFDGVPPGQYTLLVAAPGFQSFRSGAIDVAAGEDRTLGGITLAIPANHADAYVSMDRREIAQAELHAAEQQRIVGFPDFYTSFVWNAAPLDARQKMTLGLRATTDRMAFVTAGIVAGAEQIKGTFPEFGDGPAGFGKRYGAAYADGFVGKFLGGAVLPSVFRQDPRYFYMGPNGTLKQRVRHAVLSGFLARGDNGKMQPNYSHILGNAGAGAISTLYHPAADSAGKLALDNALLGTLGEAGVDVVRELFLKRFVRGGDPDANGMP